MFLSFRVFLLCWELFLWLLTDCRGEDEQSRKKKKTGRDVWLFNSFSFSSSLRPRDSTAIKREQMLINASD